MNTMLKDLEKELEFIHFKSKLLVESRDKVLSNENNNIAFHDSLREYGFRYQQGNNEIVQRSTNILDKLEKKRLVYDKQIDLNFINPIRIFLKNEINIALDLKKQAKTEKRKLKTLESKKDTGNEEEISNAKKKSFISEFLYTNKLEGIKSLDEFGKKR